MPKGIRNPENMPRGMCICGRPTIAEWADDMRCSHKYVCDGCRKASRECQCERVIDELCSKCGERIGVRDPNGGIVYLNSITRAHVCKPSR